MTSPSETDLHRIESIVTAAHGAAATWAAWPRSRRARTLCAVAERLESDGAELVAIAMRESHLTEPRLRSELARTTFQLRLFADVVDEGGYLDVRIDHADAQWPMGVRPDLRRTRVPYGAVVGSIIVMSSSLVPNSEALPGVRRLLKLINNCDRKVFH